MTAGGPLDFATAEVRTREITRRARTVVRLEHTCAKLRAKLEEAETALRNERRFLRAVIADTVEVARIPMRDGGPLPDSPDRCPVGRCVLDVGHEWDHAEDAQP